jgi:hypothetical protein
MRRRRSQRGQGLVELVALVPALAVTALLVWELSSVAYAWILAGGAARAGARAAEVGVSPAEAVRAVLPLRYERGTAVVQPRGDLGIRVHLLVPPPLLPFLPPLDVVGPDAGLPR